MARRIRWHDGAPYWGLTLAACGDYRAGIVKVAKIQDARTGEAMVVLYWNDKLIATNKRYIWPDNDIMDLVDRHRETVISKAYASVQAEADPVWGQF